MYDTDRLLSVTDGEIDVYAWATEHPHRLGSGQTLLVPRSRLHGMKAASPQASLTVQTVERRQQ